MALISTAYLHRTLMLSMATLVTVASGKLSQRATALKMLAAGGVKWRPEGACAMNGTAGLLVWR